MFAIVYAFHVKPGQETQFEAAWAALTRLFYRHAGSLGSRLHKPKGGTYIAYAQWPDRKTWEGSAELLPPEAEAVKMALGASCEHTEIVHELEVATDLLQHRPNREPGP